MNSKTPIKPSSLGIKNLAQPKFICKVFPNGSFTAGWDTSSSRSPESHEVDYGENFMYPLVDEKTKANAREVACNKALALGSLDPANSPKKRRGTKGITSYGRRMVENAAFLLEKMHGHRCLSFITLTIPHTEGDDLRTISENWSYVVKEFAKKLGRRYSSKTQQQFEYVAVTEIQEKRIANHGQAALHLHILCTGRRHRKSVWVLTPTEIREVWKSILERFPVRSVSYHASENVCCAQRGIGTYLGKYLSKGVEAIDSLKQVYGEHGVPTAWYSVTRSLGRRIKRITVRSVSIGRAIPKIASRKLEIHCLKRIHSITIESELYGTRIIGYSGCFYPSKSSFRYLVKIDKAISRMRKLWID